MSGFISNLWPDEQVQSIPYQMNVDIKSLQQNYNQMKDSINTIQQQISNTVDALNDQKTWDHLIDINYNARVNTLNMANILYNHYDILTNLYTTASYRKANIKHFCG